MCQCDLLTFLKKIDIFTGTTITPCVGGGHNSEIYWVGGNNISPITRAKSIQAQRQITSTALPSSQINARKAFCTRKSFPWKNPRAKSLLKVGLPVLSPTCYTLEWTPPLISTIHI